VGIFSLAKTKLPSYVTPCYPALALLAGCFIHHLQQGSLLVHRYWLSASFATLGVAGFGFSIGIPLGLLGIIPITAAVIAAVAWHFQKTSWPAPLVASAGGLVVLGILALGATRADQHRHDQQMVVAWASTASENAPIASYGALEPSWVFYTHHSIPQLLGKPEELALLLREHPQAGLITKEQFLPSLREKLGMDLEVVASAPLFLKKEQLVVLRRSSKAADSQTAHATQGNKISH
jgi:hypothetical protein